MVDPAHDPVSGGCEERGVRGSPCTERSEAVEITQRPASAQHGRTATSDPYVRSKDFHRAELP